MQVNQGKTNPNTAGILSNGGLDPLKRKSTGCQDEDSINEVVYAAQVKANFFQDQESFRLFTYVWNEIFLGWGVKHSWNFF